MVSIIECDIIKGKITGHSAQLRCEILDANGMAPRRNEIGASTRSMTSDMAESAWFKWVDALLYQRSTPRKTDFTICIYVERLGTRSFAFYLLSRKRYPGIRAAYLRTNMLGQTIESYRLQNSHDVLSEYERALSDVDRYAFVGVHMSFKSFILHPQAGETFVPFGQITLLQTDESRLMCFDSLPYNI